MAELAHNNRTMITRAHNKRTQKTSALDWSGSIWCGWVQHTRTQRLTHCSYTTYTKLSSLVLASIFCTCIVTFFSAPLRLGFWPAVEGLPLSDRVVKFGLTFKVSYHRIKLLTVPLFNATGNKSWKTCNLGNGHHIDTPQPLTLGHSVAAVQSYSWPSLHFHFLEQEPWQTCRQWVPLPCSTPWWTCSHMKAHTNLSSTR